ncbi:MAG: type II toxin-antitoxin system Phd/YefM family antitoxin [Nitrospira sp.]|nr:type II toxin-antitoxin system Phd/YefM family antitoxin [Nitrospira sp.]MDH5723897.1 type II toxin-antitoxin system Phd/YefM family antitoxin [Nitrospira sp.]
MPCPIPRGGLLGGWLGREILAELPWTRILSRCTLCSTNYEQQGNPMVKTLSAKAIQNEFPSLLGRVRRKKDTVIVEEQGQPVAAMMPFDRYQLLTKKRNQLFAVIDRVWAKNKNVPARQALRDATQAVKHTRATRRSRRRLSA